MTLPKAIILVLVCLTTIADASSVIANRNNKNNRRVRGLRKRGKAAKPTDAPTYFPSAFPSHSPSDHPSASPSDAPSGSHVEQRNVPDYEESNIRESAWTNRHDKILHVNTGKGGVAGHNSCSWKDKTRPLADSDGCYRTKGYPETVQMTVDAMPNHGDFCYNYSDGRYMKRTISGCWTWTKSWIGDDPGNAFDATDFVCLNSDCTNCLEEGTRTTILYDSSFGEAPENKCWTEVNEETGEGFCEPMSFPEYLNDPALVAEYYDTLAKHSCIGNHFSKPPPPSAHAPSELPSASPTYDPSTYDPSELPSAAPSSAPSGSPVKGGFLRGPSSLGPSKPDKILRVNVGEGQRIIKNYRPPTDSNGCIEATPIVTVEMTVEAMTNRGEFCYNYSDGRYMKRSISWCSEQKSGAISFNASDLDCRNSDCTNCQEATMRQTRIYYDKSFGGDPENKCWTEDNFDFVHGTTSEPMSFPEDLNNPDLVRGYYDTLALHSCVGDFLHLE